MTNNLVLYIIIVKISGCGGMADAPDLESGGKPCGFKSHHPHLKHTIIKLGNVNGLK